MNSLAPGLLPGVEGSPVRWHGVVPALVTDLVDPAGEGRIRIRLPWSPDSAGAGYEAWARVATLFAGNDRGSWFQPEVDDEVLVAFLHGSPHHPVILGGMWNGQDAPPVEAEAANRVKMLKSRRGVTVTLTDDEGRESLKLETPGGQILTLSDGPGKVEIRDSNGNTVTLEAAGITFSASAKVTVQASQVAVSAGMVEVSAGMSRFSGVVQCDTLIASSVVASSYTPGAGNIW